MKYILIAGASSGIGEATARYLNSQKDISLFLIGRNEEKLKRLAEELGDNNIYMAYDLMDLEHIENIFSFCKKKGWVLDGLVYCAGINHDMPIKVNRVSVMQEVTTVNYMAFVELTKFFIKKQYSKEGVGIVAISSGATQKYAKGMCTYTASKCALEAAVKTLARETVKRGIRVNAVAPSYVDTEMVERINEYMDIEQNIKQNQGFGMIPPEHVAYSIEFLLSDKAKYITGAILPISAGNIF